MTKLKPNQAMGKGHKIRYDPTAASVRDDAPGFDSMVQDQIKRFERWRKHLPANVSFLVALTLEEVVPLFIADGFARYPDYADGSNWAVGANTIPLQRRSGREWPTIEIRFERSQPTLGVTFAALPEICVRHTGKGPSEIPHLAANVVEGPAFFSLCQGGGRNFDCNFGYRWFSFQPKRRLQREIAVLKSLSPWILQLFERGIPAAWLAREPGRVDRHAYLSPASRCVVAARRGQPNKSLQPTRAAQPNEEQEPTGSGPRG